MSVKIKMLNFTVNNSDRRYLIKRIEILRTDFKELTMQIHS